ncbi:hypothetical protein CDD82_3702 [Ophiocordyceps australis]|uniref:Uncharacterized protein n=1 Tax=Ophiocordyceps australis TaxID=1399860 RepID=A0A2C5ZAG0_9HYPO|nr:hypothetical protein CDD82_3702 [Ophiocordyceps australis]
MERETPTEKSLVTIPESRESPKAEAAPETPDRSLAAATLGATVLGATALGAHAFSKRDATPETSSQTTRDASDPELLGYSDGPSGSKSLAEEDDTRVPLVADSTESAEKLNVRDPEAEAGSESQTREQVPVHVQPVSTAFPAAANQTRDIPMSMDSEPAYHSDTQLAEEEQPLETVEEADLRSKTTPSFEAAEPLVEDSETHSPLLEYQDLGSGQESQAVAPERAIEYATPGRADSLGEEESELKDVSIQEPLAAHEAEGPIRY